MSEGDRPARVARRPARPQLPRRFYEKATAAPQGEGFAVLLDGRVAKTPAKRPLVVARRAVAEALADEWERQRSEIDPATMPLTRIVNAAIDRVADHAAAIRSDIVNYAGSDLVCYRAAGPASLVDGAGEGLVAAAGLCPGDARRPLRARRRRRPRGAESGRRSRPSSVPSRPSRRSPSPHSTA